MKQEKKKELLFSVTKNDIQISLFSGSGNGGQNRNKKQICVRMVHAPSGSISVGQRERTLPANMKDAFRNLVESKKFKAWHKLECARRLYDIDSIEDQVMEMMDPKNIKIEVKDENGRWKEVDLNYFETSISTEE